MPLYNNSMTMRGALGITRSGDLRTGRTYSVSGFGADAPPCAPCDAARRAAADRAMGAPPVFYDTDTSSVFSRYGRFGAFGEVKSDPAAPLTDYYGRTDDSWDNWMNEAARTWARVTGNVEEAIKYRNRGVQLNNAFGTKGVGEDCSTFLTPLPSSVTDCGDVPLVGLACRGLPANFHPCEDVVRSGLTGAIATGAQKMRDDGASTWNAVTGQNQPSAEPMPPANTIPDRAALMTAIRSGVINPAVRESLRATAASKLSTLRARMPGTEEDRLGTVESRTGGGGAPAKMNTALIVGGVAAVAVAFFLLKK